MKPPKVIISGGGTGGHIFPAIAIANALKAKNQAVEILFVGAEGRMEMEKVPEAGYKIVGLRIAGLQRSFSLKSIKKNLSFPFKLIGSLMKAKKILKEFKPDVVVGVGGYASGPMLRVATGNGVPGLIQEQNSYPGITNKLLGNRVSRICVAYDGMEKYFPKEKIILTGNPVRKEVVQLEGKRERAMEFFGLDPNKKTILVIGGSLGARSINQGIKPCLDRFRQQGLQLIWQTGKLFIDEAEKAVASHKEAGIQAHQFIKKMDYAYAAADLVVSRAGAIAVSELCLTQKPSILVPYPHAAEDHQTKNALALVNHGAAVLIPDQDVGEKLGGRILELMESEDERQKLSRNISGLGFQDADEVIANEVLNLIKN